MGVYEDEGRILAVCFYRLGMEFNLLKGPPVVQENLSNEPFGYAKNVFGTIASQANWTVPFIASPRGLQSQVISDIVPFRGDEFLWKKDQSSQKETI